MSVQQNEAEPVATRRSGRGTMPTSLIAIGVLGHVLTYAVTLLLARTMPIAEFEAYVAAAALFVILVAAAPLGAEKLALRVLPPYHRDGDLSGVAAYLRFAVRRSMAGVAVMGGLGLLWAFVMPAATVGQQDVGTWAIILAVAGLPFGVAAHLAVEVKTALGRPVFASAVFRIVPPMVVLLAMAIVSNATGAIGGIAAIVAWGFGWAIVAVVLWGTVPREYRRPMPSGSLASNDWTRAARPLWVYRLGFAFMLNAGVLALDWFGQPAEVVGGYAAAAAIVGLMTVLVTSTNRAYARALALLIDKSDAAGIRRLKRARWTWLLPLVSAFLVAANLFPEALLSAFGSDFVAAGVPALRILSLAAAISILLALTPTRLKYDRREGRALGALGAGLALQVTMLILLVPPYGASAAAAGLLAGTALMHGLMLSVRS